MFTPGRGKNESIMCNNVRRNIRGIRDEYFLSTHIRYCSAKISSQWKYSKAATNIHQRLNEKLLRTIPLSSIFQGRKLFLTDFNEHQYVWWVSFSITFRLVFQVLLIYLVPIFKIEGQLFWQLVVWKEIYCLLFILCMFMFDFNNG